MSIFVVDVESDGDVAPIYSMISFGAIKVQRDLVNAPTFYGETAPISPDWKPDALAVSNISREQHMAYPDPYESMSKFHAWVLANNTDGRPILMSDNPTFDGAFMNYYFHRYIGENPFGFSARRIGDFYAGLTKDFYGASKWKNLRKTKHTHNPVDDARGNAEALLAMCDKFGVKINV